MKNQTQWALWGTFFLSTFAQASDFSVGSSSMDGLESRLTVSCAEIDGDSVGTYPSIELTPGQSIDFQSNLDTRVAYFVTYHKMGILPTRPEADFLQGKLIRDSAIAVERSPHPLDRLTVGVTLPNQKIHVKLLEVGNLLQNTTPTTGRASTTSIQYRTPDQASKSLTGVLSNTTELRCEIIQEL